MDGRATLDCHRRREGAAVWRLSSRMVEVHAAGRPRALVVAASARDMDPGRQIRQARLVNIEGMVRLSKLQCWCRIKDWSSRSRADHGNAIPTDYSTARHRQSAVHRVTPPVTVPEQLHLVRGVRASQGFTQLCCNDDGTRLGRNLDDVGIETTCGHARSTDLR